jgi:hypothetical protein
MGNSRHLDDSNCFYSCFQIDVSVNHFFFLDNIMCMKVGVSFLFLWFTNESYAGKIAGA